MFRLIRISVFIAFLAVIASVPFNAQAQEKREKKPKFNVEKFLKRLDTNQNGKVDPSEIKDDRTRGFLKNAGVDPSKPISIKGFAKKIKNKREQRDNPRAAQQTSGFAVSDEERSDESGSVLGFAVTDEERAPVVRAQQRQFSEKAKQMLEWVLKNYDKNKDGKIDKNEIKGARWADPPASVSDTNKDGSLSKMELLIRYQNREDEKAKKDKSRSSSRSGDRSNRDRSSGRERRSSTRSSAKSTSGNNAGNRDVRKGYENYVAGLFKSYDKNKDGYLDTKEVEGMRRKPDKKVDANGDKKISKDELIDSYLEKAGQRRGKTKSGSGSSRNRSSSSSNRSNENPGTEKVRSPLTAKDKNKNGKIEMAEYVTAWTTEMVEEFDRIDTNKDGVITRAEWNAK